jgi:hypothetical protein
MSVHLTPTELADELDMDRVDILNACNTMGIPVFHGKIDKTLFQASLNEAEQPSRPVLQS